MIVTAPVEAGGYDAVARAFARLSRRFTSPVAARLVCLAQVEGACHVLDVGTGTGIVALEAARRLPTGGTVVGVDLAAGMLDEARTQAREAGLRDVVFREADAHALPLADATFDTAFSLYALAHLRDPGRALGEMFRVLRPGGRLAVGIGARPPLLSREGLAAAWRRGRIRLDVARHRCRVAPGRVESLLKARGARLAHAPAVAPNELARLARTAGFADVRVSWHLGETDVASAEELWELHATFSTPVREWLASAEAAEAQALRAETVADAASVLAGGGRLLYLFAACLLAARRP